MLKVKTFVQSYGYCGPASLRILLSYYHFFKSERALAKLTGASRVKGTSPNAILKAAKKLGFNGYIVQNSTIGYLKKQVGEGIPVIVDWFSPHGDGHYSVVVGFERQKIIMADPYFGKLKKMKINDFAVRWFDFNFYPARDASDLILRLAIIIHR